VAQSTLPEPSTPTTGATGAARANDRINDATISAEVNAGLVAEPRFSGARINVDTRGGVVTLTGAAPDDQARLKATEIAATPKGVVRVENQLAVGAPAAAPAKK
jgi:osmotically-inducible protein OsmY